MSSVFRAGPTAAFYDIYGKRRVTSFKERDDAVYWIEKQKEARDRGEGIFPKHPKQTVAEFLQEWLVRRVHQVRPNTYRAYEQTIKHRINPHIGHLNAAKLRPILIEEMIGKLIEADYKAGSIIGVVRVLSKAYNDGVRLDLVPSNPMKKVEVPNLKSVPLPAIPWDEVGKLYKAAESNPGDQPGVVLMMYATRESRIYAPILLGVLGLHSREKYGVLPVGSHDLSCHSFPIQKRLATILGQLPATSPVNFEDWFKSAAYIRNWAEVPLGSFEELPIGQLAEGKKFLMEIVRGEKKDQIQPAFESSVDEFSNRRRANGLAFDEFAKNFRTQN